MRWWRVECLKTHRVADAPGDTFKEACDRLGLNSRDCRVLKVWS